MTALYVLYDNRCGLCTWLSEWLGFQRVYIPVMTIAAASSEGQSLASRIPRHDPDELIAIAADGRIWRNHAAWLAVLWALRDYRRWARRLASPAMLPLARHTFIAISKNRLRLWHAFRVSSDQDLKRELSQEEATACQWNG